jgi:chromosome segregation protein
VKLKSLEIKGFKSFADKTTIHINKNVTGVVGPNGCGKSNIVDAVRWVLGEQKSSVLRSEKMENLIFNGTKKRRSSSLAEVHLTFENTKNILPVEYENVTISRHYFRSGESEYRLNDIPCRLRDIQNLFMDTGIGSDSYAIIELSMVDDILSDKDNSRRRLFEQAAGIEKYKKRKKETFNKLSLAQNDLERVEDLLFEIESNLKTLESQARRAKRYYKLKEKYKALSIELARNLLADKNDTFQRINKQLDLENDKILSIETRIKNFEAGLEAEKKDNIKKEQALSAKQKEFNLFVAEIQEKENQKRLLAENIKLNQERKTRLQNDAESASKQIELLNETKSSLEQKLGKQNTITEKLKIEIEAKREALNKTREAHQQLRDKTESERTELIQLDKDIFDIEKKQAINQVMIDNLSSEIEKGSEQEKAGKKALDKLNNHLKELNQRIKANQKALEKLNTRKGRLHEEFEANEALIGKIKTELEQQNRALDAKRNEYQLIQNMLDSLEGYPESIKFLRREVKYTKHAPLLSDIISCKEPYRAAIENYLEHYLNYYVVNTIEDAIASINLLSDAAKGRANFFILSEFANYRPDMQIRNDNAISALDILEVEPKYNQLASWLLDHVYFVEDLDAETTSPLPEENKTRVYITKSGKFIRARFSLSGGAIGLFEGNKLGRKKNLERLSKTIKTLEEKSLGISQKLNSLLAKQQELKDDTLQKEIEKTKEDIYKDQKEIASIQTSIQYAKESIGTATTTFKTSVERIQSIQSENDQLEKEIIQLQKNREVAGESFEKLEMEFKEIDKELLTKSQQFNQENIQYHQQINLKNTFEQELQFTATQIEQAGQMIVSANDEHIEIAELLKGNALKIEELESTLSDDYGNRDNKDKEISVLEEQYYKSRGKINEIENDIRGLNHEKDQNRLIVDGLKEKINDLKIGLTSMKERMSVEFDVNIEDILDEEPESEFELEELNEQVAKMKLKLEKYGNINPMAVEAYDEMLERYNFINGQKTDLLKARDNLMQTIEEIDNTAKSQFLGVFEHIRENFQKVFRTLFTDDDNCNLIMLNADNPLESKIEIIAQPKGKKPLIINQLSGGEKTLTAIALLFALYLVKPAPFCIFDEVDAPLDDVNISKFTKIIRQFSKDSQFIIVTHNKQTMSSVDVIYGITMIEDGISRVVPVDFSSLN